MKTQKNKTLKALTIVVAGIAAGALPINVVANDHLTSESGPQLIYQSRSINHSIFSYLSNKLGEIAVEPKLIYVSQAYGPAIYSYAHAGAETAVPWSVEYVNPAYNPAIYSYEGPLLNGNVKLLPTVIVD